MGVKGMSMEQVRFAVAMRMGRTALGLSQSEFAELLGVAKSTIARTETMEMTMRADTLMTMLRVLREHGVELDLMSDEQRVFIEVHPEGLQQALEQLQDEDKRRSDRQRRSSARWESSDGPTGGGGGSIAGA